MFKKLIFSVSLLFGSHLAFSQGVAINEDNSSADASAILDIKSTTKGMLAPRMTASQKTSISSPATGLLIYQTNGTSGFYYYNGSSWTFINAAGQNGLNSLSRTSNESAGSNCADGGIKVEYGLDINNNGVLNAGEENAMLTKYVCNGATGATGPSGSTGAAGQGVPTGGTAGQVLTKINGTNYNTQWTTVAGGAAGLTLKDNNNVVLGKVISTSRTSATVLSSTGYLYDVQWDGTFIGEQLYYSTGACGGTKWLNSGSSSKVRQIYSNDLTYDGATGSFYKIANPDSDGLTSTVFFTAGAIWSTSNQNCGSASGTRGGWLLTPITKAAAGIPNTIAAPLHIE